jgi:(p)ppGpp synthase/HD superfamily hydrolase
VLTQLDLARAIALAAEAHARQIDKCGRAYILHPIRVMQRCERHGLETQIVAVLHDVVEDTWVTLDFLRSSGFPDSVIEAIDAITQREGRETYFEYIHRCSQNRLAALVKLADLDDNSDPIRCFSPDNDDRLRRYGKARAIVLEHVQA